MSISKKTRFEVFKRDSFTCQYCGRSAPDVLLHADHIEPKSKGGEDDILNLVTSCQDCNLGKSDRKLSDDTTLKKRKQQLDELQKRREQLDLLMQWHNSLLDLEEQAVTEIADFWTEVTEGYELNEKGLADLKKWVKKFGTNEVIEAIKIATGQYLEYHRDKFTPTQDSVNKACGYIPKICTMRKRDKEAPYLKDLYYIRGILRNRLSYINQYEAVSLMEEAHLSGFDIEEMKILAKTVKDWPTFMDTLLDYMGRLVKID